MYIFSVSNMTYVIIYKLIIYKNYLNTNKYI